METVILLSSIAAGITSVVSAVFDVIRRNNGKANGTKRITISSEDGLKNTYVLSDQELTRLLGMVDGHLCPKGDDPTGEVAVAKSPG